MTEIAEKIDRETRFDFTNPDAKKRFQTGTLKELLSEINRDSKLACGGEASKNGTEANLKSLERTLKFIRRFTGLEFNDTNAAIPIHVLKTIKLLYFANEESMGHMFRWIEMPGVEEKATFEFRTTGVSPRNNDMVKTVNDLLHSLSLQIDPLLLRRIETTLLTPSKLLQCIQIESHDIVTPFELIPKDDDRSTIKALRFLTESIRAYGKRNFQSTAPLHGSLYTYLRTLSFHHFVGEYKEVLDLAKIDTPINPIIDELRAFCVSLSDRTAESINPDTPAISLDQFALFAEENVTAFGSLIKAATGIKSERRDLIDAIPLANKILFSLVFHTSGKAPLYTKSLSVSDCVASLCAVRHQQKVKTPYAPFWIGQKSSDNVPTRLLSHLGKDRAMAELYLEDYIPQGASQLLFDRFRQFHAAFEGRTDLHQAWMEFHAARLDSYVDRLQFTDIDCIDTSIAHLDAYCHHMAIQAVRSLDRQ